MRLGFSTFVVSAVLFFASSFAAAQPCQNGAVPCKWEEDIKGDFKPVCCPFGMVCIDKECKLSPPNCLVAADCGPGRTCTERFRCTCAINADCGDDGQICGDDNVCFVACNADEECRADHGPDYECNQTSRCERKSCVVVVDGVVVRDDNECKMSQCLDTGYCGEPASCTRNFHCRNFVPQDGRLLWICGPEGLCTPPPPASGPVACTCSLGAEAAGALVPASLLGLSVLAVFRARSRRRAAARRAA